MKLNTPTKQSTPIWAILNFILTGGFLMSALGHIDAAEKYGFPLSASTLLLLPATAASTLAAMIRLVNPNPRTALAHELANLACLLMIPASAFILS